VSEPTSAALRRELVDHLRAHGHVRDTRVAAAFAAVPRELFVADHVERHGLAGVYRDDPIVTRRDPETGAPLSSSSQPAIMAKMLEMLAVRPGQRVLEIGAGTGYNAALLAHLAGDEGAVTSVELDADTAVDARRALLTVPVPARGTVRVEVGDGGAGWPADAPYDAVIVTACADRVARAWFDQLRPGGRLVVPLRLSPVVSWLQAVVALRKVRQGFDHAAITPGGFMALRPPPGRGGRRGAPSRLAIGEVADGGGSHPRLELTGPALAGLDRTARQHLTLTALGFARSRRVVTGRFSAHALLTYVALALPEERLVEVTRPSGPRTGGTGNPAGGGSASGPVAGGWAAQPGLGVVDAVDGSLAALVPTDGGDGVRLDAYGGAGAERALLAAADRWIRVGRPGIADARITVRYGSVRPHAWSTVRRGDQWIALDWARPDA
jgi:protein-L-isoaspartate(D-aspartate) O-methyltransferase